MICDNIPFNSMTMQEFAKDWNFEIVTRSPNYPKSNELAEKAAGIAKLLLKKVSRKVKIFLMLCFNIEIPL